MSTRAWLRRLGEPATVAADRPRVVVPVEILEGDALPAGVVDLLGECHVVLLGYLEVPEQTPPDQARLQFEDRAEELLAALAGELEAAGASVEPVMAFTHDAEQTIARVGADEAWDAELVVRPVGPIERVVVAVTPEFTVERVFDVLLRVLGDRDPAYVLIDAGDVDAADVDAARRDLLARGVPETRVSVADAEGRRPVPRIADAAGGADLVAMARPRPDLESALLGDTAERVATAIVGPVLVVTGVGAP